MNETSLHKCRTVHEIKAVTKNIYQKAEHMIKDGP